MSAPNLPLARQKADTILIETSRIEGALMVIRDLAGFGAAKTAADVAVKRVCRTSNDNEGWVA